VLSGRSSADLDGNQGDLLQTTNRAGGSGVQFDGGGSATWRDSSDDGLADAVDESVGGSDLVDIGRARGGDGVGVEDRGDGLDAVD
jgi:hypothetical protein